MTDRQNRWVLTAEEVRATEQRYADPKDSGITASSVQVVYETDPAQIDALLPPPLCASARPRVWVSVGHIRQISLGVAQVAVSARYGDEEGWYCLHMPMTLEAAVVGGRERYGENKKIADIRFERDGDRVQAGVTRCGITYLEFTGDVTGELELPEDEVVPHYYFKYSLAADGSGFDHAPLLIRSVHTRRFSKLESIDGKLVLRESATDPVADLPVERMVDTCLTERTNVIRAKAVEQVDPEAFLPFVYQRYDFAGQG